MDKLNKVAEGLELVVKIAGAIVALAEICKTIAPEVKKIIEPLIQDCKNLADNKEGLQAELKAIKCC